jgi:hypothetical protein
VVRQNPARRASGCPLEIPKIIATLIKLITLVLAVGKSYFSFTAAAGTMEVFEAAVRSRKGIALTGWGFGGDFERDRVVREL